MIRLGDLVKLAGATLAASLLTTSLTTVAVFPATAPAAAPAAAEAAWSVEPARRALTRLLPPGRADEVVLRAEQPLTAGVDHFRISAEGGRVVIGGTTPGVLLRGFHTYLGEVAQQNISWNGSQVRLPRPLPLPAAEILRDSNATHRFALNDTDDGYTGAYRTWQDWEHEIDVLALHGINEVFVPVGAEAVYLHAFQEFGYSEQELLDWIPQPAHQPWWLLQNMCCFPADLSREVLDNRVALGRRIVDRLRELGITPVLPGYFGTVPDGFEARNPGAAVVPQGGWVGFTRPGWLDPTGPVFPRVAEAFYRHSEELFGASTMYKMDLLHEGGRAGSVNVAAASRAVESALQTAHPGAFWAILGWQNNPRLETLAAIDRSRMLVVDGLSDRYSGLQREASWLGAPYAFGSIWNFGGHTTMGANIGVWNQRYWQWAAKAGSALDGIAVLPEASDNNPVAFDFLTELPWQDGPQDMAAWYAGWAERRYGAADPRAAEAWRTIGATAYSMPADGWSEAHDGLFAAQPSLTANRAAEWSPGSTRYEVGRFATALPDLLAVDPALRTSSAYRYDLMDVARQVLSNHSRALLPQVRAAYDARDLAAFRQRSAEWMQALDLLDRLMATNEQTMLGPWIADARSWAADDAEADRLEHDARRILGVWGHRPGFDAGLSDYANREWAGLVSSYYAPRWRTYLDELEAALVEQRSPRPIDWYDVGDRWAHDTAPLPTEPVGKVHELAGEVVDFLRDHPLPVTLTTRAPRAAISATQPAVVEAVVRNPNVFTEASAVQVSVDLPAGLTARAVGESTKPVLAPGESWTARFEASVDAGAAVPLVVTPALRLEATTAGAATQQQATVRLLTAEGVEAPYRTVSFNGATFAQRGEEFAIVGGGADMWGGTNQFGAIHRPDVLADGTSVTTRVVAQDRTGPWARAGLVVRDDMASQTSRGYLNLALTPDNGCVLSWDGNADGRLESFRQDRSFAGTAHLRLTRSGQVFRGECSTDGQTWREIGSVTVAAGDPADVGLFMTAAGASTGLAHFHGFRLGGTVAPQPPAAGTHQLSALPFVSSVGGHGPWERDMHNGETAAGDGGPLVLAGTTYPRGLGTNADAEAVFHLGRACLRLEALVGIDDTMAKPGADGDVVFRVYGDGVLVYDSGVVRAGEQPRRLDLPLAGVQRLRLVVDKYDANNWWDRADWADAKVTCV